MKKKKIIHYRDVEIQLPLGKTMPKKIELCPVCKTEMERPDYKCDKCHVQYTFWAWEKNI